MAGGGSCATSPGERVARGLVGVFVAAFALSNLDQLWCAIPAGICSLCLIVGAITGWCPTDLFRARQTDAAQQNVFGFQEARQQIELQPQLKRKESR